MPRIASVDTHMISVPRPFPVWTAHEPIIFSDKPGFGLEIDWAFVDRYRLVS